MRFIKKWVLANLIVLSGCVSLPKDQQTENLLAPPSVQASVERGLESGYFSVGNWPEEHWWEIFNAPELNDLIAQALGQNPTIQGIGFLISHHMHWLQAQQDQ